MSSHYRCRECAVFVLDSLIRAVEREAILSCKKSKKIRRYLLDSVTTARSRLDEANRKDEPRFHKNQNLITTFEAVDLNPIFEVFEELRQKLLERQERTKVSLKRAVVASTFIKEMLKVLHRGAHATAYDPTVLGVCTLTINLGEIALVLLDRYEGSQKAREQNVNDTIRQITTAVQRLLEIRE